MNYKAIPRKPNHAPQPPIDQALLQVPNYFLTSDHAKFLISTYTPILFPMQTNKLNLYSYDTEPALIAIGKKDTSVLFISDHAFFSGMGKFL